MALESRRTRPSSKATRGWPLASRSFLYDGLIAQAAQAHSVDPKLVKSVMLIESAFNPTAVSRKGRVG